MNIVTPMSVGIEYLRKMTPQFTGVGTTTFTSITAITLNAKASMSPAYLIILLR